MIRIAKLVDAEARRLRKQYGERGRGRRSPRRRRRSRRVRFAALGTSVYPDATFTLRLNFGTVQGWNEFGTPVVPFTRLETAVRARHGQ